MNKRLMLGISLTCMILILSCNSPKALSLEEEYNSLKTWPTEGDLTNSDWNNYVRIAKLVQNTDSELVKKSMDAFISKITIDDPRDEYESKLFLLMRVVFKLPEAAPKEDLRSFKGWNNWSSSYLETDRANLSWPVSWKNGNPSLLSNYSGSEGLPYSASSEYEYFLKKYPFRELQL